MVANEFCKIQGILKICFDTLAKTSENKYGWNILSHPRQSKQGGGPKLTTQHKQTTSTNHKTNKLIGVGDYA